MNVTKTPSSTRSSWVVTSEDFTSAERETVTAAGVQPLDDSWTLVVKAETEMADFKSIYIQSVCEASMSSLNHIQLVTFSWFKSNSHVSGCDLKKITQVNLISLKVLSLWRPCWYLISIFSVIIKRICMFNKSVLFRLTDQLHLRGITRVCAHHASLKTTSFYSCNTYTDRGKTNRLILGNHRPSDLLK